MQTSSKIEVDTWHDIVANNNVMNIRPKGTYTDPDYKETHKMMDLMYTPPTPFETLNAISKDGCPYIPLDLQPLPQHCFETDPNDTLTTPLTSEKTSSDEIASEEPAEEEKVDEEFDEFWKVKKSFEEPVGDYQYAAAQPNMIEEDVTESIDEIVNEIEQEQNVNTNTDDDKVFVIDSLYDDEEEKTEEEPKAEETKVEEPAVVIPAPKKVNRGGRRKKVE